MMIPQKLLDHLSLTSLLKLVCSCLTLFLIYQEVFTYTFTKPTTVSSELEQLDEESFPEVTACLDPGFNSTEARRQGYVLMQYPEGIDDKRFVGWNGKLGGKDNSSVMRDILSMKINQKLFNRILFADRHNRYFNC